MASISRDFGDWVKDKRSPGLNGYGDVAFYVSEDTLKSYWSEARVSNVLSQAGLHLQALPPPKSIIQSYIRIFSTLVYIATTKLPSLAYLSAFSRRGFDDHNLPIIKGCFPETSEGREVEEEFIQFQFLFNPVVLDPGLHQRELDSRCVLPLTFERKLSGHFGSSAKSVNIKLYKLHKASKLQVKEVYTNCLTLNPRQDRVVIKEYPSSEIEHSFKNELDAYLSFQYPVNEHNESKCFLEYYGSFTQEGKGYIILEYANEGSLLEFFKSNKVPRTRGEFHGLFERLSGLLDGLRILHAESYRIPNRQLRGVHQDLKPANIFVFRNDSGRTYKYTFKIGDFGLASFTPKEANEIKGRDNKGGIMYNAPEMTNYNDLSRSLDEGISPLVDIWSFGCVLFETAVWAISDERGREEFRNLRCEENNDNRRLRDQGYGASFHNGTTKLKAVDEMLTRILEQRRVFDDITEGFCKLVLKYAMVPVRKPRYDARELWAVIQEYLENVETQQILQAQSPTSINSACSFDHRRSSFDCISGRHHTPMKTNLLEGDQWASNPDNMDEIDGLDNIPGTPYSKNRPKKLLTPPKHGKSLQSNTNGFKDNPEKETSENANDIELRVPERPIPAAPHKQASYPKFGVADVIDWISSGRNPGDKLYISLSPALETLNKRQQVFLIDDTADMKKYHWASVIDTFRALAHLTNKIDPDGIELYFRSSPDQPNKPPRFKFWNGKTGAEKLVDKVVSQGKEQEDTICYMQSSISRILNQVKGNITDKKSATSIYILTDGIWDDATDRRNMCGVDNAIRSLIREMCRLNREESHVSIQFIRFGDSEVAKSRLRYLDNDLAKKSKSYDIVDTTTDRSPVWKMLLGSIIGTVDDAADD